MAKKNKSAKSLRINYIFFSIKSIMTVLFPLISFPYASRILNVEGIGQVQYCTSIVSYFSLIATLGITTYAIREGAKLKNDRYEFSKFAIEIFSINIISTLFAYGLLFLAIIFHFFNGYTVLLLCNSLTIICSTLSVEWIYQAEEDYVYISIRTIIFQAISLILLFLFVKSENDLVPYSLILVFSSGGYCLINFINATKYISFRHHYSLYFKKHIKSIMVIFSTTIASSIYLNLDIIMIRFFSNDYQVGLYSAATKINVVIRGIINSASTVLMPRLSYYQGQAQKESYYALLKKGIQFCMLISIPCGIGLLCISPEIITLVSGPNFIRSATTCSILALNMIVSTLDNVVYTQILIPNNLEKEGCKGTILGAISNFILNCILIPLYKIEGAAVASLIAELVVFLFFMWIMRKSFRIQYFFEESYKILIAACGLIIAVRITKCFVSGLVPVIIFSVITASITYFAILLVLKYSLIIEEVKTFASRISSRRQ